MLRATEVELTDGLAAESLAGRGRLVPDAVAPHHDKRHAHCDVLVIGGGAAGCAAAVRARPRAARGSSSPSARPVLAARGRAAADELQVLTRTAGRRRLRRRLRRARRSTRASGTSGARGAVESARACATGARADDRLRGQRPAGRDARRRRGGVRGALRGRARHARRALRRRRQRAARPRTSLDARPGSRSREVADAATATVGVRHGGRRGADGGADPRGRRRRALVPCDLLLVAGGWNPSLELWTQAQGTLRWDDDRAAFVPEAAPARWAVVGAANGTRDAAAGAAEGAARRRGGRGVGRLPRRAQRPRARRPRAEGRPPLGPFAVEPEDGAGWEEHYLDLQRDATVADLRKAVGAGLRSPEHVKRFTTIGTANDQGRTSGVHTLGVLAGLLGAEMAALAPTTPPAARGPGLVRPARGPRPRRAVRPRAPTPIHAVARGARRRLRGRRAVEAALVLPARRRGHGRGRPARVPRRARGRGDDGRLDARQDRRPGAGRRRVPQPPLHRRLRQARHRSLQVRAPLHRRRDALRRRRAHAARRATATSSRPPPATPPRCSTGSRSGCRRSGPSCACTARRSPSSGRRSPSSARARATCSPRSPPSSTSPPRPSASWTSATPRSRASHARVVPHLVLAASSPTRSTCPAWHGPGDVGGRVGRRRAVRHHALRDRDDARAARGEGLRDRRAGDRRHGDAAGRWAWSWMVAKGKHDFVGKRSHRRVDAMREDRKQLVALLPEERLPEGAQLVLEDGGADGRARHVELRERGAGPAVLPRAAGRRPRAPRRDRARAADRPDRARARSPTRCSTTRRGRGVTARSPLAERAAELAAAPVGLRELPLLAQVAVRLHDAPGAPPRRAGSPRASRSWPPRSASRCPTCPTPRRATGRGRRCGWGRTSGSSSGPRARSARSRRCWPTR